MLAFKKLPAQPSEQQAHSTKPYSLKQTLLEMELGEILKFPQKHSQSVYHAISSASQGTCALPVLPGRDTAESASSQQNDSLTSWAVLWAHEKNVWK